MDDHVPIDYVRKPHVKCPHCKGTGYAPEWRKLDCDWCDGDGYVTTLTRKEDKTCQSWMRH